MIDEVTSISTYHESLVFSRIINIYIHNLVTSHLLIQLQQNFMMQHGV